MSKRTQTIQITYSPENCEEVSEAVAELIKNLEFKVSDYDPNWNVTIDYVDSEGA
jgi:hypothetical protein